MSWFGGARPQVTGAGGEMFSPGPLADLGDVHDASYRLDRVTRNWNAEQIAGELIYDQAIEEARAKTGVVLQNPYRLSFRERYIDTLLPSLDPKSPYNPKRLAVVRARDAFQIEWSKLEQRQLDSEVPYDERLGYLLPMERIRRLVAERQGQLSDVQSRASDFDAFVGGLTGGFAAAATDPIQYAGFAVPTGGGATVLGNAVRGALANAGIEAALQPSIASWHEELGLEYTAETALTNIAFAALFGGALEGGGSAAYRTVRGSPEYRRAKALLDKLPEDHTLRQALSGKRADTVAAARKLRGALDGVGRFALDAEEAQLRARENVPEGTHPREHETTLGEAQRAAARDEPPPRASRAATSERPELGDLLDDALADTARGRDARDLARLSDGAYSAVTAGRLTPEQGALISRLVPDEGAQDAVARELAELGALTPAQSRVVIGALLEARAPGAAARALGGEDELLARQRSEVAALDADYAELKDLEAVRAEVQRLELRQAKEGTLDETGAARLAAQQDLLRHLEEVREAYDADLESLRGRQAAEQAGRRMQETRDAPDPDGEAVGETFEEMLGEAPLTPEDLGRVTDAAPRPREAVTDFRAEADAIDQLAAPDDPRAAIRSEAEEAFGEAAARVIADDPGTDQGRVYLFKKDEDDGLVARIEARVRKVAEEDAKAAAELEKAMRAFLKTATPAERAALASYLRDLPGSPEYEAALAKGLDMSAEARRARAEAQGYTIEAFRGIRVKPGSGELPDEAILGNAWFSDTPGTANTYAADVPLSRNKGMVAQVRLKLVNPLRVDAGGAMFDRLAASRLKGLLPDEMLAGRTMLTTQEVAAMAKRAGFDGVEFTNIKADKTSSVAGTKAGTVWAVFDPSAVRSVHAAFDPDAAGKPGLLLRKTGAKPGKTWMKPIDITHIKEDAAVLNRALDEAAACAAGFPVVEGALAVGGAALGAAALGGVAAGMQERQAAAEADYSAQLKVKASPVWQAREAGLQSRRHVMGVAAHRAEARRMAQAWKAETLDLWRADLNEMPDDLPQYRMNQHVQDLTGVRADFLDTLITHESAGDWAAKNPDSTATGGGQFIDSTWREMMRKYGANYGHPPTLKGWTDAEKAKVMALRTDPRWGTVMTAEYALENARTAEAALGRPITQKEGYLAHFLGVDDFLKLRRKGDDAFAADVLPRAAAANLNVFYVEGDVTRPRTTAQMFALQGRRFSNDPLRVPEKAP
jgi:hypothetical protein